MDGLWQRKSGGEVEEIEKKVEYEVEEKKKKKKQDRLCKKSVLRVFRGYGE